MSGIYESKGNIICHQCVPNIFMARYKNNRHFSDLTFYVVYIVFWKIWMANVFTIGIFLNVARLISFP